MSSYQYIYGPVSSWRLGISLGIDPISAKEKVCSFDCIYCQAGPLGISTSQRKVFVPVSKIIKELDLMPQRKIDYITFSGLGEPTLAKNLGSIIKAVKKVRAEKIAVLTNSSLIDRADVQKDLSLADCVIAKLDVSDKKSFTLINRPNRSIKLNKIVKGLISFRRVYTGRLTLQIMFSSENKVYADAISEIAREIEPDEVQLNTPLRPCGIKPLSKAQVRQIKKWFKGMNVRTVYDVCEKRVSPINKKDVSRRRGK